MSALTLRVDDVDTAVQSLWECTFEVDGMTCAVCEGTISNALRALPGVTSATVSNLLRRADVTFTHADGKERAGLLLETIEGVGFDAKLGSLRQVVASSPLRSGGGKGRRPGEESPSPSSPTPFDFPASTVARVVLTLTPIPGASPSGTQLCLPKEALISRLLKLRGVSSVKEVEEGSSTPALRGAKKGAGGGIMRRGGGKSQQPLKLDIGVDIAQSKLRRLVDACGTAGWVGEVESAVALGGGERGEDVSLLGGGSSSSDIASVEARNKAELLEWFYGFLFSAAFAVPCFLLSMVIPMSNPRLLASWGFAFGVRGLWVRDVVLAVLAAPVQFWVGSRFYKGAWAGIKGHLALPCTAPTPSVAQARWATLGRFTLGMDFLVALGTTASYVSSVLDMGMGVREYALAEAALSFVGGSPPMNSTHGGDMGGMTDIHDTTSTRHLQNMGSGLMGDMGSHGGPRKMPVDVFFDTSAILIAFVMLGKTLESLAKGRTGTALSSLVKLQPATALLVVEDPREVEYWSRIEGGGGGGKAAASAAPAPAPSSASAPAPASASASALAAAASSLPPRTIPINLLAPGDLVLIKPGSAIPCDGMVEEGESEVDESMLTGEVWPVVKGPGDGVTGATVNKGGVLKIRATRVGGHSTLSQILSLVQKAQMSKAPIQAYADLISGWFTPAVFALSVITGCAWGGLLATGAIDSFIPPNSTPFMFALRFAIAVVVVACPCALGLATPTAIMVGTGVGARGGVLIKGGDALETASHCTAVIFDKTGTLTRGSPELKLVTFLPPVGEGGKGGSGSDSGSGSGGAGKETTPPPPQLSVLQSLSLIASVEALSEHPLGVALYQGAMLGGASLLSPSSSSSSSAAAAASVAPGKAVSSPSSLPLLPIDPTLFQAIPGCGVVCTVSTLSTPGFHDLYSSSRASGTGVGGEVSRALFPTVTVRVGTCAWLVKEGIVVPLIARVTQKRCEEAGRTTVLVAFNGSVRAVCSLVDTLKSEAEEVVAYLSNPGRRTSSSGSSGSGGVFGPLSRLLTPTPPTYEVWMVTGDALRTAKAVAGRVGIPMERVVGGALPTDKVKVVEALQARGHKVAMVGDGINDTIALAAADVGIAIGAGSQVAIDAARIVLLGGGLGDAVFALELSKAVMSRIKRNFVWALGYNVCGIPIAAGVLYPWTRTPVAPETAGLAMALSSVSVVLSSLLLKGFKKREFGGGGGGGVGGRVGGGAGQPPSPSARRGGSEEEAIPLTSGRGGVVEGRGGSGSSSPISLPSSSSSSSSSSLTPLPFSAPVIVDLTGLQVVCSCSCKGCTSNTLSTAKGLTRSLKMPPPPPPQTHTRDAFSGGGVGLDEERVSLSQSSRAEEELSKSQLMEILEAESEGMDFTQDCHCCVYNGGAEPDKCGSATD